VYAFKEAALTFLQFLSSRFQREENLTHEMNQAEIIGVVVTMEQ
jgi:hypothetical protein